MEPNLAPQSPRNAHPMSHYFPGTLTLFQDSPLSLMTAYLHCAPILLFPIISFCPYLSTNHLPYYPWARITSCASVSFYCQISTHFAPGDFQGFALVNPQRSSRVTEGFSVQPTPEGAQLSFNNFAHLGHESFYWQLPETYQGDKV